jgi:hypothetical protein
MGFNPWVNVVKPIRNLPLGDGLQLIYITPIHSDFGHPFIVILGVKIIGSTWTLCLAIEKSWISTL